MRPLGKHRSRQVDNIKNDLGQIICTGTNWIQMNQHKDQWQDFGKTIFGFHKSGEFLDQLSNYKLFKKDPALFSHLVGFNR
jgi:hypothetical protein